MAAPVGTAKMEEPLTEFMNIEAFVKSMRTRVKDYIDKHHYDSALFWADKLISLSDAVEDVFWYAQTMFYTGQHQRAVNLLTSRKLIKSYPACRYLAALCHYECKEWQEALNALDMLDMSFTRASCTLNSSLGLDPSSVMRDTSGAAGDAALVQNCENSICLLRGKIYEAMDNRSLAADCYREALRLDVYCFEAFDLLVSHHMLTATEERELIETLPFDSQCPVGEAELVRGLYQSRMKKYDCPKEVATSEVLAPLADNLDVVVSMAEQHLYNCNFRAAHKITSRVLRQDRFHSQCLPIHIAVLVELKMSNELFYLAHKLVDSYPNKCISWFAVGCYYMLTENYPFARWYLSKATTLERAHGPSWLAFGHTFGMNNDHDQAMAAYFTASQIMRGCHLPVLYIGLEYGLTNNPKLAERFFSQAHSIAPSDPFVLHEMAVIHFGNGNLSEAERLFQAALAQVQVCGGQMLESSWEPLLNNLGHVARRQRRYEEALDYHRQALILCPQSASTYSAIGFVHSLMGNHSEAVNYFHKALGLRKDDTFSTTMLTNSMDALMSEISACDGAVEDPKFQIPPSKSQDSKQQQSQQQQQQLPLLVKKVQPSKPLQQQPRPQAPHLKTEPRNLAQLFRDCEQEEEEDASSSILGQTREEEEDDSNIGDESIDDLAAARGLVTPVQSTARAVPVTRTGGGFANTTNDSSSLSIEEVDMDD